MKYYRKKCLYCFVKQRGQQQANALKTVSQYTVEGVWEEFYSQGMLLLIMVLAGPAFLQLRDLLASVIMGKPTFEMKNTT